MRFGLQSVHRISVSGRVCPWYTTVWLGKFALYNWTTLGSGDFLNAVA